MDVTDDRNEQRYFVTDRLEGSLAGIDLALLDLGQHGAQLKHATPIKLGTVGRLSIKVPEEGIALTIPAHVVWSRLAAKPEQNGARPYYTGVRIDDPNGEMASVIGRLLGLSILRPDKVSIEKKRKLLDERARSKGKSMAYGSKAPRIPDDVILLVRQTRDRLRANPAENVKWLNRAKYSLDRSGAQMKERDDVLAVWEYLERSVEISIISRILDQG